MRARLRVRAEAVPRVRRVFKERASLLLRVIGCACLAISEGYDEAATYSKNLISDVFSVVHILLVTPLLGTVTGKVDT
jgi:hypothetical protein